MPQVIIVIVWNGVSEEEMLQAFHVLWPFFLQFWQEFSNLSKEGRCNLNLSRPGVSKENSATETKNALGGIKLKSA